MRKSRTATLLAIAMLLPVAVWATNTKLIEEPASKDTSPSELPGATMTFELPPPVDMDLPPRCERTDPVNEDDATGDYASGCCWIWFNGHLICVPC